MKNTVRLRLTVLSLFLSSLAFTYGWNVSPASATHLTGHTISEIVSVVCGDTGVTITYENDELTVVQDYTLTAPNKLRYFVGTNDEDVMKGTSGADTMVGYGGNDIFCGFDGDDTISAGEGNDILIGGNGNDTLVGDGGEDYLEGDAGNDTLSAAGGNDILNGGDGKDICSGGPGTDSGVDCETKSSIEVASP